ncbi:hypothetical protein SISNIDRAFT_547030 [Sistotremastrum niveocremeum HHB9708]|uniref:P-loop containing nucleoside triphosphate hydrolase protein n=1 Tax=Sistotremastrum niveocremeum HHB9708 TaxID=1314777 RepID=A0A164ZSI5_9AGAM|nr:hypothetical protein SISNIDRAFT_547030 [Sistotremastrum niveocremeum HHB9708]
MPVDILKKRKIAVLGSRSVGKSSLILQYTENHFVDSYYPTIEATIPKTITYRGVEYECEIIDTAGQDEFSILNSKHAIGIHGFVLVYSVASRNSLEMVKIVYDKIIDFCGRASVPCVVVGAKLDLPNRCVYRCVLHIPICLCLGSDFYAVPHSSHVRQVATADAESLAKELNAAWIETSAKLNTNVSKVFELCLAEIEKSTGKGQPEPKPSTCLLM